MTQIDPLKIGLVRRQVAARVYIEHVALCFLDIERRPIEGMDKRRLDRRAPSRNGDVPEPVLAELGHERRASARTAMFFRK